MNQVLIKFKMLLLRQANLEKDLEFDKSTELNKEITEVYNDLISFSGGVNSLLELMQDKNPWVRFWVASSLRESYPEEARIVFTELSLRDDLISSKAELQLYMLGEENE